MTAPVVKTTKQDLRAKFNDAKLYDRVLSGELNARVVWVKHPAPVASEEPFCTQSQIVEYRDRAGELLAMVHQYLRQDNTLGGFGLPDPKVLLWEGKLLRAP